MFVAEFSRVTTINFKIIKGHNVTVAMQRTHLVSMQTPMLHVTGGYCPLSPTEAVALDDLEWVLSK